MRYQIIQPPFTLRFREMSRKELDDYFQWFLGVLPDRIVELEKTVKRTPSFEAWRANYAPESLDSLGHWLYRNVESRPRTDEEIQEIVHRSSIPIGDPGDELTNRTFSFAVDTGMYLSQVLQKSYPALRWSQDFGNKQAVDYGQPVLVEFHPAPLNPVRLMVTLAYGLVRKSKDGGRLRGLYDYWKKRIVA